MAHSIWKKKKGYPTVVCNIRILANGQIPQIPVNCQQLYRHTSHSRIDIPHIHYRHTSHSRRYLTFLDIPHIHYTYLTFTIDIPHIHYRHTSHSLSTYLTFTIDIPHIHYDIPHIHYRHTSHSRRYAYINPCTRS